MNGLYDPARVSWLTILNTPFSCVTDLEIKMLVSKVERLIQDEGLSKIGNALTHGIRLDKVRPSVLHAFVCCIYPFRKNLDGYERFIHSIHYEFGRRNLHVPAIVKADLE